MFGQKSPFGTPSMFGAQSNTAVASTTTPGGLFSNTSNMFASSLPATNGTTIKFDPPIATDTMMKNNTQTHINTKHLCITAMKQYENKSMEELRCEDYLANRKGPQMGGSLTFGQPIQQQQTTTSNLFGSSNQPKPGLFGSTATTGGLFGSTQAAAPATTGLFGAVSQPAQTNFFGTTPNVGLGSNQPKPGLFGSTATTGGLFGSTQAAAPATTGLFGAVSQPAQTNFFGTTPTTGLGTTGLFGAANKPAQTSFFGSTPTTGLGSNQPKPGLFGSTATTGGLFGSTQTAAPATTGLFGAVSQPAQTNFFGTAPTVGTGSNQPKPGLFGSTATTGGLFGSTQSTAPATTGLFGAVNQPAQTSFFGTTPNVGLGSNQPKPGLFGSTATTGGLFGSTQSTAPATTGLFGAVSQPAQTNFFGTAPTVGTGLAPTLGQQQPMVLVSDAAQSAAQQALLQAQLASSPYGDSPLLKLLSSPPKSGPSPPAATAATTTSALAQKRVINQALNATISPPLQHHSRLNASLDNSFRSSSRYSDRSSLAPSMVVNRAPSSQLLHKSSGASLFDSIDDDVSLLREGFVPRKSVRQLNIVPRASRIINDSMLYDNNDDTGGGNSSSLSQSIKRCKESRTDHHTVVDIVNAGTTLNYSDRLTSNDDKIQRIKSTSEKEDVEGGVPTVELIEDEDDDDYQRIDDESPPSDIYSDDKYQSADEAEVVDHDVSQLARRNVSEIAAQSAVRMMLGQQTLLPAYPFDEESYQPDMTTRRNLGTSILSSSLSAPSKKQKLNALSQLFNESELLIGWLHLSSMIRFVDLEKDDQRSQLPLVVTDEIDRKPAITFGPPIDPINRFESLTSASITNNRSRCLLDLGLFNGRCSRVGWLSNRMFAASAALNAASSIVVCDVVDECSLDSSYFMDMFEHNIRLSAIVDRASGFCPRVNAPTNGAELVDSFAETAKQCFGSDNNEEMIWRLCSALWAPVVDHSSAIVNIDYQKELDRKQAVSKWLKTATTAQQASPDRRRTKSSSILTLMQCGRIDTATETALDSGDVHLAMLLTLAGASSESRALCRDQLVHWSQSGADRFIDAHRLRVFALLAGEASITCADGTKLYCANDVDWRSAVGLYLWYLSDDADSFADVLHRYDNDVSTGVASAPIRRDTHRDDLCWQLMKLAVDRCRPLDALLCPSSHTVDMLDYHISWHLWSALSAFGYRHLSAEKEQYLHNAYAGQLAKYGHWHYAIFVLMHISNDYCRTGLVQQMLARYYTSDEQTRVMLVDTFHIPDAFIQRSKIVVIYRPRKIPTTDDDLSLDEIHRRATQLFSQ